jgi:Flp pilus assembly protein TadB
MPDLAATTASDVALGVLLGLSTLVMLVPFIGAAFVARDVVRQWRTERRNAAAEELMPEGLPDRP